MASQSSRYFSILPLIPYDGKIAVNLLARSAISEVSKTKASNYYPYTVKEGDRADVLAETYYNDGQYDWMIFLANQITDPYYDYTLRNEDFDAMIIDMYGSIPNAYRKIMFYQSNHQSYESQLTPGAYEALPPYLKKYWEADVGFFTDIVSYSRKKDDVFVDTNKIQTLHTTSSNNVVTNGDILIRRDVSNTTTIASGEVVSSSDGDIIIKHVEGDFESLSFPYDVRINDTDVTIEVNSLTNLVDNFKEGESVYYSPLTAYDYHLKINQNNSTINVIDNRFLPQIVKQIKKSMV